MKLKHLLLSTVMLLSVLGKGQIARVQFIANCPEVTFNALDIYVNGTLVANDLIFRHSSQYMDLPAGTPISIGVAEQGSLTVADTFYNLNITLTQNQLYLMVGNGTKTSTGFTPYQKFKLDVFANSRESANLGETQILFANGSTDAPVMDIRTGVTLLGNDLGYGMFEPSYKMLTSGNSYIFRLTNPTGNKITHNFKADFSTVNVSGKAVTVLTSGFMNPAANNNGEDFGLWLSMPEGGPMVELEAVTEGEKLARIQLIHNSADTAVGKVDVYVNSLKVIDSIDFRQATEYMDAYADFAMNVGFARAGTGVQFYNTNITLDSGFTYSAVLHGIESDTFYKPRPPLTLSLYNGAREEASTPNSVDLLFMNGATDGPLMDVMNVVGSPSYSANLGYGNFSNYSKLSSTELQGIKVDTGSANVTIGKFEIKTGTLNLNNKTVTIVSSGFVSPDSNSKGPAYGYWLARPEGGPLTLLPIFLNVPAIEKSARAITAYPNPASATVSFDMDTKPDFVSVADMTGKVLMVKDQPVTNSVDIHALAAGTYLLVVHTKGEVAYARFQKL